MVTSSMIKRRLRPGWLYLITGVNDSTIPELKGVECRVIAQFPDAHLPGRELSASVIIHGGGFTGAQMLVQGTFRLKNPNPQTTCLCRAYQWPHRLGSGKCWGLRKALFCGECGRPANTAKLGDETVSQCCASPLFKDCNLEEPA